jgi:hypothetical protein
VSFDSPERGTSDCESNRVSYMQYPNSGKSYAQNSLQFITTHNISENSRYHDIRIFNNLDVSVVTAGWSCAMGVPQHCTLRCLNRAFHSLLFSRALQIFAPQTGRTCVFRENSTVQSARSRPTRHMGPRNGRSGESKGQKSSTASGSDRASPPQLDSNCGHNSSAAQGPVPRAVATGRRHRSWTVTAAIIHRPLRVFEN